MPFEVWAQADVVVARLTVQPASTAGWLETTLMESIGVGVSSDRLAEFQEQGIGKNVVPLDPRDPAGARIASGFSALMFVDRAPHPNAAKVFINWLLDKDAQALWVDASNTNSRRIDVPGPASTALYPEVERRTVNDEAYFDYELKAREIAKQVLR